MHNGQHSTSSASTPRWKGTLKSIFAVLIALAMSTTSFVLFTRNNDFPLEYHPDEWSKVNQVASTRQMRNVNHPLLMLETASLANEWFQVPSDDDLALAVMGRNTSGFIASVGVFCFAMAGYVAFRFAGLALVGTTMMLCPQLLVYAHYFKEDATLAGGIGLAVLGATLLLSTRRSGPQLFAAIVLGVGCACAASGKYVGAAIVVPALLALLFAPVPRWWVVPLRLLLASIIALAGFVAINARAFEDPWTLTPTWTAREAFDEEFHHGTTQHGGIQLATPGLYCIRIAASEVMAHLWIGLGVSTASLLTIYIRKRRRILPSIAMNSNDDSLPCAGEVGGECESSQGPNPLTGTTFRTASILASFLVTFAVVLTYNAIPFARYALPITVLAYSSIAYMMSAAIVAITPTDRSRLTLVLFTLSIVLFCQGRRCLQFDHQFADDSRQRLREWVATNLPRGAVIVSDNFAQLSQRGDRKRFPKQARFNAFVRSYGHAANSGPLQQLAANGVKYVVVAEPNYQRFFAPGVKSVEGGEAELAAMREFYTDLFARGTLLWSSKPSPPSHAYVDPELAVYDITIFKNDPPKPRAFSDRFRNWFR